MSTNSVFIFIADFFADQVLGGGELNNEELINLLKEKKKLVKKINSTHVDKKYLEENKNSFFIIGNFVSLNFECREWLTQNANYVIYEHDHKYLASRNPAVYKNFKAPITEIRNFVFYKNAKKVICQTNFHKEILCKNLDLDNVISVGGNLWSLEILEKLREFAKREKRPKCSIMRSNIPHKNTAKAINYCQSNGEEYDLVSDNNYISFLEQLSRNKTLVFFPGTPETLSRIICEARMMGMSVKTNGLVGAVKENWFELKGSTLIDYMTHKREEICNLILEEAAKTSRGRGNKKVSIITTFYKGEEYLEGFFENITNLDMFDECELILIDSASPGREREIVKSYSDKYDNIIYHRLEEKFSPTVGHNLALQQVTAPYITWACIDDRKRQDAIRVMYNTLCNAPDIDLVYGDCLVTSIKNETCEQSESTKLVDHSLNDFSRENMIKCLPGPMPLWKRTIHDKCGFFDTDSDYTDDWEMWLRAVYSGCKFKKVDEIVGLYYTGGRSFQSESINLEQRQEEAKLFYKYSELFGNNFAIFKPYFDQFI